MLITIAFLNATKYFGSLSVAKSFIAVESCQVNNNYCEGCDGNYSEATIDLDLIEGYQGIGYNTEEIYQRVNSTPIQFRNVSTSNRHTCNTISSSHGPGR